MRRTARTRTPTGMMIPPTIPTIGASLCSGWRSPSLAFPPMKIACCIKRVPDSETRVKIAADGKSLDEAGVKFVMNPYDEFAVEEALRRKEKAGTGEVVVICLGPAAGQETIRTTLAMGADRGILLQTDRIPADGLEVAKALAAEPKGAGFDLILFGKVAI